jgi:hypothetical protein
VETPKPKRIRKPGSSGGTDKASFRIGSSTGLLARGLNRHGDDKADSTAKSDLQEYYNLCELGATLRQAVALLREAYGSSFPLELIGGIAQTLPEIPKKNP